MNSTMQTIVVGPIKRMKIIENEATKNEKRRRKKKWKSETIKKWNYIPFKWILICVNLSNCVCASFNFFFVIFVCGWIFMVPCFLVSVCRWFSCGCDCCSSIDDGCIWYCCWWFPLKWLLIRFINKTPAFLRNSCSCRTAVDTCVTKKSILDSTLSIGCCWRRLNGLFFGYVWHGDWKQAALPTSVDRLLTDFSLVFLNFGTDAFLILFDEIESKQLPLLGWIMSGENKKKQWENQIKITENVEISENQHKSIMNRNNDGCVRTEKR